MVDAALQLSLLKRNALGTDLIYQPLKLTATQANTEELHSEVGNLVRFVQDDRFGTGQELDKAGLLHRQIRQQQVVIDHHQICFLCRTPCFDDVTLGIFRALLPKAIING